MNYYKINNKKILFAAAVFSVFLVGCGLLLPGINQRLGFGDRYESNGASIYYSGRTLDGEFVEYSGGGFNGMMMNQRTACAACHGDDGSGGRHVMHMQVMDAPDIRYAALSGESEGDDHSEDAHDEGHGDYDLHTFERAVVFGEHPNGDSLSREMPRWQLSEENLEDLFEFIQTLD